MVNKDNIELKTRFQSIDNEYALELSKFRNSLDEKEKFFEKFKNEQDLFESERDTLNALVREQDKY